MATHPMPEGIILAPDPLGEPVRGTGEPVRSDPTKVATPGSGTVLFGRYKLDRILGRGGMGVVWLAEDQKLERPVALKFLPSLLGLDPGAVKELKIETRRGLDLSHPHIVRIYDFVDDEDTAAISMEFVDGKTLSELRMSTEHGVFTVAEVSQWLKGVCEALDYAHFHRQLVHRDLKPANIMVTANGMPKIADFGIARSLADTMSRLSAVQIGGSGTLPYMSPQQAMGDRPVPTDDVYSLAATLYEMLAGKPPFYRGDMPTQVSSKIPPSVRERRCELEIQASDLIPREWEDAIALALHKDPAMRPASAGAFAESLGLRVAPIGATTYSTPASSPSKSPPVGRTAVLTAAAALFATAGIIWWGAKQRAARSTSPPPPAIATAAVPTLAAVPEPLVETPLAPSPSPLIPDPAAVIEGPPMAATPPGPRLGEPQSTLTAPPPPAAARTDEASEAVAAGANATPVPQPPLVVPPPAGYWELEQIVPNPPFSDYTANGKRQLLYNVQTMLKEQGLYTVAPDGKPGKVTHNAIVLFQSRKSLPAHGLLDLPTLTALELADEGDDPDWQPPTEATPRRRRAAPPAKPTLMDRMKKIFK